MSVLLLSHPDCLRHVPPRPHPERPERLRAVDEALRRAEVEGAQRAEPPPAEPEILELVHTRGHLDRLRRAARGLGTWLDPDTYAVEGSWPAALAAAGASVAAVEAVASGRCGAAFALVRPPGHHAGPDRAMGFCLVNHVAVAARWLVEHLGLERVLILDWDVHHGNGTQEVFWRDGRVLFVSLHQEGWYPGTGSLDERGEGDGEGLVVNVPLPAGVGDEGYRTVFEEVVLPLGDAWVPEFVLVSAGFDAHHLDPLGRMQLSEWGYARLARLLQEAAGRWCAGRLSLVLEGGYDLAALCASVVSVVRALCGERPGQPAGRPGELPYTAVRERVRQVRRALAPYWSL